MIPAYNAANTIRQTFDSCLNQSYSAHEIIVVDDCSQDDTAAIAETYSGIKVITLQKNSGPSYCRNYGWEMATGDIIAFLDADDTWHPGKLEIIRDIFNNHPDLYFLGHPYTLDSFKKNVSRLPLQRKSYLSILISNPFQSSCISVRRALQARFDASMRYCEDQEFSLRVAYKYGCYLLPYPLTRLGRPQLTAGGASGNIWKMRKGELRAYGSIWRSNPLFSIAIPALWVFSMLKYVKKLTGK